MNKILIFLFSTLLIAQTADVQIVHNSPYPTVDIYVDGAVALESVPYRASTGLVQLPINTEVGIAPAGGEVIATFPFELSSYGSYVVVASGIVGDESHPFDLLASTLDQEAADENSFALKVMHGVTDAPAVDIYADGNLLVENLSYGDFQGYLQVPVGDYTLDITAHGSSEAVASFSAPLSTFGGLSGVVYASGFLSPTETDSAFTLMLTTPSGYIVELPATTSVLSTIESTLSLPNSFYLNGNYPNPFNPVTSINYNLNVDSNVDITIYDIRGNAIKNLYSGYQKAGLNNLVWDATNAVGQEVSSGVYLYKVQVGDSYQVNRMMFLK